MTAAGDDAAPHRGPRSASPDVASNARIEMRARIRAARLRYMAASRASNDGTCSSSPVSYGPGPRRRAVPFADLPTGSRADPREDNRMPELERHHHQLAGGRPTMEYARVTVVVASRNRRKELLRSLGHHRAPVVLVDNGSTDGTPDAVRRTYPHVEVVELGENRAAAGRTAERVTAELQEELQGASACSTPSPGCRRPCGTGGCSHPTYWLTSRCSTA